MVDIFSAFGLSFSAGLNAYLPVLMVALAGRFFPNWFTLTKPYDVLTSWWVIGVLVVLVVIEFFVDKVPAVDTVNDVIQTVIRPAAGALMFAASTGAVEGIQPVLAVIAGLLIAGGVHATKATIRPVVTATTAGIGNPIVSVVEDVVAFVTSLLAIVLPVLVGIFLIVFVIWFFSWRARRRNKQAAGGA